MVIKRFDEFPEASGTLTSDDIFLFMDDPAGDSVTKKISLSHLVDTIGISAGVQGIQGIQGLSGSQGIQGIQGLQGPQGVLGGDIIVSGTTISTANSDQDMTITTNGSGDIYIGADKNMIFDMNAWSAKGILIQDSQEDGYDDSGTPSTLKVGSIYHETGYMVIESDGRILDASGIVVDENGVPSEKPVYGGLWITNGQDTGLAIPGQTGTVAGMNNTNVEIHNNEIVWEFKLDGTLALPTNGLVTFPNNTALMQGTFDNNSGGQNGISLYCSVGYELNWQGGHLISTSDYGATPSNIYCDSPIEFIGSGIDNVQIDHTGITFSDGTTQTSAGVVSNTGSINGSSSIINMIKISQNDYDNIVTKDPNTLYFIV